MLATTASDAIVVNVNSGGLVQSTIGGNGLMMTNHATATATLNLNTGGTVFVQKVSKGSTTTGTSNFNFDGGTLKASVNQTNFMTGLDSVKIKSGGAKIDTNTFDVTIGQNLLTDAVSTGGGLTKSSAGTLTLTGANTYTGANNVTGGTLATSGTGTLGTGNVTLADTAGVVLTLGSTVSFGDSALLTFGSTNSVINMNFTGIDTLGGITNGSLSIGAGSYTATQLNTFFGGTNFVDSGALGGQLNVVPEPSTYAMLLGGMGMLLGFQRSRRRI